MLKQIRSKLSFPIQMVILLSLLSFTVAVATSITMADEEWIGLGWADGRIVFNDEAVDTLSVMNSNLEIYSGNIFLADDAWIGGFGSTEVRIAFDTSGNDFLHVQNAGVTIAEALSVAWGTIVERGLIGNETGGNYDSRLESEDNPHMVFVDASANRVGIGDSTPDVELDVVGELAVSSTATFGGAVYATSFIDTASGIFADTSSSFGSTVTIDDSLTVGGVGLKAIDAFGTVYMDDTLSVAGDVHLDSDLDVHGRMSGLLPFAQYVHTQPMTASGQTPFMVTLIWNGYIDSYYQSFYGASPQNASNKWTIEIKDAQGTVWANVVSTACAAATWCHTWDFTPPAAQLISTTDKILYIEVTKTGSPGNLYLAGPAVFFRTDND